MKKRGRQKHRQVTTFVIISIIILALIGLAVYFRSSIAQNLPAVSSIGLSDEEEEVRVAIQDCFDDALTTGILLAEHQSGKVFVTHEFLAIEGARIPYAYDTGKISIPTIALIENDLEKYTAEKISECVTSEAQFEEPTVSIDINKDEAVGRLTYAFTIETNNKKVRNTTPYTTQIQTELVSYLRVMNTTITSIAADPNTLPLGVLSVQDEFKTETLTYPESTLYVLTSLQTNHTYFFATRNFGGEI